jgi:hydroxymethylbilane synthase
MAKWVVGTRASKLALVQTRAVVQQLDDIVRARGAHHEFVIETIVTDGDRMVDVPLAAYGGKGLFCSAIERRILDGTVHLAVHSMKDMPYALTEGLTFGAILARAAAHDALVSREGYTLETLPLDAHIGTASVRRACLMRHARTDVRIDPLRGNVDTRIQALTRFDAIVLAAAGLERLGSTVPYTPLPVDTFVPAAGQGALAIQCKEEDEELLAVVRALDDAPTRIAVEAERSFLAHVHGGCQEPIGVHVTREETEYVMRAAIGRASVLWRQERRGPDPYALAEELAQSMRRAGACH